MKGGEVYDRHSPDEIAAYLELSENDNGVLWKVREPPSRENKRWNTRYAGKPALITKSNAGYFTGRVCGKQYYLHRVVWCLRFGEWPKGFVDHLTGDKTDNSTENLRVVLKKENNKNSSLRSDSKTGITGVTIKKGAKVRPYIVNIKDFNGWQVYGGAYATLEEAAIKRKELEFLYGYHKNHGKVLNED